MVKSYLLFVEALLVAGFIFTFGILTGIFIENARTASISNNYALLESDVLDARLISDLISSSSCETAIKENMDFADRIFFEAKILSKYESSNEITDALKIQHKKYDLLRAIVWANSIKIQKQCNVAYHDVVYLYKYDNPTINEKAKQEVISNILSDIKEKNGDKILLISIAGDINSPSIDLLMKIYNVNQLPSIVIDEKVILTDITNPDDVEKYL